MKGWRVSDGESWVLARAATRGAAKRLHPNYSRLDHESFLAMRAWREPWLDGDGPEREIFAELEPCPCEKDPDGWGCGECFEGERLSTEKTLARLEAVMA